MFWPLFTLAMFLLQFWSGVTLGRSWSVTPQARQLVTHGPYRYLRNPLYTFNVLFLAGLFMSLHWYWGFATFIVIVPMQVMRARAESRVLAAAFGPAYVAYRRRTIL